MEEGKLLRAIYLLRRGVIPGFVLPKRRYYRVRNNKLRRKRTCTQTRSNSVQAIPRRVNRPQRALCNVFVGIALCSPLLSCISCGSVDTHDVEVASSKTHGGSGGRSVAICDKENGQPEFNMVNFIKSVRCILDGGMQIRSTVVIDNLKSTVEEIQKKTGWDLSDLRTLLGRKSIELEQMRMDALEVKHTVPPCRFTREEIGKTEFRIGERDKLIAIMDIVMADNPEQHADCVFAFLAVLVHEKYWIGTAKKFNALCSRLWQTQVKDSTLTKFIQRNGDDFQRWSRSNIINNRRLIASSFSKMIKQNM